MLMALLALGRYVDRQGSHPMFLQISGLGSRTFFFFSERQCAQHRKRLRFRIAAKERALSREFEGCRDPFREPCGGR